MSKGEFAKDIVKEYGDVLHDAAYIIDNPPAIIPLSPKLDIALGGGVPEGSLFIMTGQEKVGKDQPLDAMVHTPVGPKKMGDIKVGDEVLSPSSDSGIAKVVGVFPQGLQDVYRVHFSDRTYTDCGLNHLWHVANERWKQSKVIPLKEILYDSLFRKNKQYKTAKYSVPMVPCVYATQKVSMHPYLMGCLIGDGTLKKKTVCITNIDQELLDRIRDILDPAYELYQDKTDPITYRITRLDRKYSAKQKHKYLEMLRTYDLAGVKSKFKFIPPEYKYNSTTVRFAIVRGLMDTDGTVDKKGKVSFSSSSLLLAEDLAEVVRSLGYKCKLFKRFTTCNGKKFKSYLCYISGPRLSELFKLTRKRARCKPRSYTAHRKIVDIEYIEKKETQCIQIDNQGGLYFTDYHIVTHNTVTALQFCKNAQKARLEDGSRRKIVYGNIEGRLKKRDLEGVSGLDLDPDYFRIIGSTKGNILSGETYLSIIDNIVHQIPHAVAVIDSFSALASEKELTDDIKDSQVAVMQKFIAKFTRRFANVLPINRVTLVGVTHIMANIGAIGHAKKRVEKSGFALKYAQDVKLFATHKKPMMRGDQQIGQEIHWIVENTATNTPPGQKVISYMKYGRGIWEEYELAEIAKDFGIIQGKSWFTLPGTDKKIQGMINVAAYLEEEPSAYEDINQQVRELTGL